MREAWGRGGGVGDDDEDARFGRCLAGWDMAGIWLRWATKTDVWAWGERQGDDE